MDLGPTLSYRNDGFEVDRFSSRSRGLGFHSKPKDCPRRERCLQLLLIGRKIEIVQLTYADSEQGRMFDAISAEFTPSLW